MTHAEIKKRIEKLEKKLREPEVVKEKTYRGMLTEKKENISKKYISARERCSIFGPMATQITAHFFDDCIPKTTFEPLTEMKSTTQYFIREREDRIQKNEDVYLQIYEIVCKKLGEIEENVKKVKVDG